MAKTRRYRVTKRNGKRKRRSYKQSGKQSGKRFFNRSLSRRKKGGWGLSVSAYERPKEEDNNTIYSSLYGGWGDVVTPSIPN